MNNRMLAETTINVRVPTAVFLKAADNGTLEKLLGDELDNEQLNMILEIIRSGTVGSIVSVDQGDTHVEIALEDDEGGAAFRW